MAIYLLAFSLRISKSLFFNYFPIDPVIRNIFLGVLLTIGPSIWFYTKYLAKPSISIKRSKILIHYVPALLYILFCWAIPNDGSITAQFFYTFLILHMAVYIVTSLIWLFRQTKAAIINESIKKWLYYFLGVTLFMVIIYFMISNNIIPYYLGTAFLFSVVIIFFGIWALKNPFLFQINQEKYSNSSLSYEESVRTVEQLDTLMEGEKLFLEPDLTIAKTSARLGISPKQLSQAINQVYKKNYSHYIAKYRVAEAKRLLGLAEYANYKISAIAYDSGFNSISSFNTTFKKLTQITAIEYRQSLLS
ncbi:helix-turn-helix domain-containing protein [Maribacter halichondriae]|uniref:helix-turn-helix domain-containing protein n=1 Tax=Maribacter halichondriae TaxID=2980554 RepID=UPI00235971BD|nr:helix-turn-helix domain-containing protein [Maribacter sp. Hal144]